MIVNYTAKGWEIITQRAHGMLAAQIASHWDKSIRRERWLETLLAIAEHDDAQVELERDDLLTPQGGPVDFKMRRFDHRHCCQTMGFALSKSRYIALLCSMHIVFVYESFAKDDPAAARFIKEQEILQKAWRKELGMTIKEAERDYRLLEWCDALSLLLCQHENQPEARSVEISNGPDKRHYQLLQFGKNKLTVTPWPFEETKFELWFETRLLEQLSFKDPAEFRKAFRDAVVIEKRRQFVKPE
ncbi:hypothetical protein GCM10023149_21900 [Mucilaginibacter gynuensis]|uniref:DUF3891 family protein n=1 Tax=Mucilaginibacter gynuensis TaxID=1302236 RepID=A0ABP8GD46_9SPHI